MAEDQGLVRRVAVLTLDEACLLVGDAEEVTLWGGVGWSGMETMVLLGQVSVRAGYTDPKESRGVQAR